MLNRRQPLTENDTLFFSLKRSRQLSYGIHFMLKNLQGENLNAYFEDTYLKTTIPLNMSGDTRADFEINGNAASADPNRFRVVFKKAVHHTSINASLINSDVAVEWSILNETDISHHEIERSVDGINFIKMGTVNCAGNSTGSVGYQWLDVQPAIGIYYYRIRSIGLYGAVAYSETVKVKVVRSTPGMYIYPNPVTDNNIQLRINQALQGVYRVRLLNEAGQLLKQQTVSHTGTNATHTIQSERKLPAGTYQLQVISPAGKKQVLSIIVQ